MVLAVGVRAAGAARSRAGSGPGSAADRALPRSASSGYDWFVDLFLAGILGYGLYFWFSGRVWCRFACPLAALMHVYARFSRFRILADKKKCISCNVCTSVCHQGIDVMNFANKGLPMAGPRVRALLGLRAELPDRRPVVRAGRAAHRPRAQERPRLARRLAGTAEGAPGAPGLTDRVAAGRKCGSALLHGVAFRRYAISGSTLRVAARGAYTSAPPQLEPAPAVQPKQ